MTKRTDEEIKQTQKVFEGMTEQMRDFAEDSSNPGVKADFEKETTRYHSLAELCKWVKGDKSMFDAMLKDALEEH